MKIFKGLKKILKGYTQRRRAYKGYSLLALALACYSLSSTSYAADILYLQQIILDKIAGRLDMLRAGVDNLKSGYRAGDLAGSCLSYGPFFFGNGNRQKEVPGSQSYESANVGLGWTGDRDFGLAGGVTGRFGAGLAGAYFLTTPKGTLINADDTLKGWTFQPFIYGSLESCRAFIDGLIGIGFNRYNANLHLLNTTGAVSGNFNGFQVAGKARMGYVMTLARFSTIPLATLEFTPLVAIQYLRLTTQQYQQTGASNLTVTGRHFATSQVSFGGKLAFVNEPRGFYTEIHVMMLYDYKRVSLQGGDAFAFFGPAFTLPGSSPSKVGGNIGASSTLSFRESILFSTGLDFEGRTKFIGYSGWLRLRWLF